MPGGLEMTPPPKACLDEGLSWLDDAKDVFDCWFLDDAPGMLSEEPFLSSDLLAVKLPPGVLAFSPLCDTFPGVAPPRVTPGEKGPRSRFFELTVLSMRVCPPSLPVAVLVDSFGVKAFDTTV